jgi:hypothetical protein
MRTPARLVRVWLMAATASAAIAGAVCAGTILETFDADTADVTDGSYPDFTLNVGNASVSAGVLRLGGFPCEDNPTCIQQFNRPGLTADAIAVAGQILANANGGWWNVGLQLGNRRFVFYPGHATGKFEIHRVDEGGLSFAELDMGFSPSTTAFHTMRLDWRSNLNELTATVEDGDGIADPFVFVWTPDAEFDPSGRIGFTRQGDRNLGDGFFDNLTIVPEPSTALLIAIGLVGLGVTGRKSR